MKKTPTGFTLIEMLVSIALLGVVVSLAVSVFSSISKNQYQARVKHDITVAGNRTMDVLSKVIRDGSSAVGGACPIVIANPIYASITVANSIGSVEYSANGRCSQTIFSRAVGVNGNGIIQKSYLSCVDSPIGGGTITEDDGKNAVDVSSLGFCVRSISGAPLTVDINMSLSPSKTLSNLAPVASEMRVNFTSSVGQRTYSP